MNKITKITFSIAGAFLISGTAFAGNPVEAGQGGSLTYTKPAARKTSVAVYSERRGVVNADRSEKQGKLIWHTTGPFGNSGPVSYYTESR
jgi:hypothetical protein